MSQFNLNDIFLSTVPFILNHFSCLFGVFILSSVPRGLDCSVEPSCHDDPCISSISSISSISAQIRVREYTNTSVQLSNDESRPCLALSNNDVPLRSFSLFAACQITPCRARMFATAVRKYIFYMQIRRAHLNSTYVLSCSYVPEMAWELKLTQFRWDEKFQFYTRN